MPKSMRDPLGVPDMEIPVRLGWKARDDLTAEATCPVVLQMMSRMRLEELSRVSGALMGPIVSNLAAQERCLRASF